MHGAGLAGRDAPPTGGPQAPPLGRVHCVHHVRSDRWADRTSVGGGEPRVGRWGTSGATRCCGSPLGERPSGPSAFAVAVAWGQTNLTLSMWTEQEMQGS